MAGQKNEIGTFNLADDLVLGRLNDCKDVSMLQKVQNLSTEIQLP